MSKTEGNILYDKQSAARPDCTPKPPTRIERLIDAVKHVIDGGLLDKVNAEDLLGLLTDMNSVERSAATAAEHSSTDGSAEHGSD